MTSPRAVTCMKYSCCNNYYRTYRPTNRIKEYIRSKQSVFDCLYTPMKMPSSICFWIWNKHEVLKICLTFSNSVTQFATDKVLERVKMKEYRILLFNIVILLCNNKHVFNSLEKDECVTVSVHHPLSTETFMIVFGFANALEFLEYLCITCTYMALASSHL